MPKPRFDSFLPPEQIIAVYGNKEVAQELVRLGDLQSGVDSELRELQRRVRETYDAEEKAELIEQLTLLRELSQKLLNEIRRIQSQFPR